MPDFGEVTTKTSSDRTFFMFHPFNRPASVSSFDSFSFMARIAGDRDAVTSDGIMLSGRRGAAS